MEQTDLLRLAVEILERLQIPYALVGSYASSIWGVARFTEDIGIVLDLRLGQVSELCESFSEPDFYVSKDAAKDAVRFGTQFNVLHPGSGNKIDFMMSRDDVWSRSQFERRERVEIDPGVSAFTASPEDVILSKLRYYKEGGSEKHPRDINGILRTQGDRIDRSYIAHWAGRMKISDIWETVLRRAEQSGN
ncbi:MAG: hypothetical protein IAG10_26845 [Planctomycetaceae bacterium]|nr:hypothetical protein [Planctomycetaceae bacterium]